MTATLGPNRQVSSKYELLNDNEVVLIVKYYFKTEKICDLELLENKRKHIEINMSESILQLLES